MKKEKKGSILKALFIVLVGALIFGGGTQSALSEPPKEIRLGDIVSHTGAYASFGMDHWGVKAAVEDINKQGGVYVKEFGKKLPVRYITRDCQSDLLKVAPLTEDLILRDKLHFIGTHLEVPTMRQGTAVMADKYKIPGVYGVGPYESWQGMKQSAGATWKYSWAYGFAIGTPAEPGDFRHGNPGYMLAPVWFGALRAHGGKTNKKVAAFALDDADGRAWYMAFCEAAKKEGYIPYRAEEQFGIYPGGTTDFSSIIGEWKKNGCEILWGNCPGPDYGILWRQARTMGFRPKMVFSTRAAVHYHDIAAWGGDLAHGVGSEIFWDPSIRGAVGIGDTTPRSLAERWLKETREPLSQGIGWSYMGAQILFDAIERAGTLDGDAVNKALSKTDMNTINGRAVFDATQFQRFSSQFGMWMRVDKPWKWESPVVFSYSDHYPATANMIFPMPYD